MYFTILTVIFNDGTKNKVAINTFETDDSGNLYCAGYGKNLVYKYHIF